MFKGKVKQSIKYQSDQSNYKQFRVFKWKMYQSTIWQIDQSNIQQFTNQSNVSKSKLSRLLLQLTAKP